MTSNTLTYVVTSYVITWIVILGLLFRVQNAVRRARRDYESVVKGDFNS